jgi:hypothetical protein
MHRKCSGTIFGSCECHFDNLENVAIIFSIKPTFTLFSYDLYSGSLVHNPYSRYHSRFFDCLAHPNLSATLATDQKLPLSFLHDLRVIFDEWQKLHLGLDALSNQKILKGIYTTGTRVQVQVPEYRSTINKNSTFRLYRS